MYPSLLGVSGLFNLSPYSTVCSIVFPLPSFILTLYLFFTNLASSFTFLFNLVSKSNNSSPLYQPTKVYPSFGISDF